MEIRGNGNAWKLMAGMAGALIATGVLLATVNYSTKRLDANDVRVEKVEKTAQNNALELQGIKRDITYIKQGIDEIKEEVKKQ